MASSHLLHPTIAIPLKHSNHPLLHSKFFLKTQTTTIYVKGFRIRASDGTNSGDSYLKMWKKAVNREKKEIEFNTIAQNLPPVDGEETPDVLERKSNEFQKILEVSKEERDRVQRMQVIDRAAAAISAARALLKDRKAAAVADAASSSATVRSNDNGVLSSETPAGALPRLILQLFHASSYILPHCCP